MIELAHDLAEPEELSRYRTKNPRGGWDDPAFRAVPPIVRRQLNREQDGLCVYCESILGQDEGHVEHIKSKRLNPALTFVYENLAHSCNGPRRCGHHKQRQELPLEPRPGCNRLLAVMAVDGRIAAPVGVTGDEANQATKTIHILGLNSPYLAWQRKGYAEALRSLAPSEKTAFLATIPFRWALRGLGD